MNSQILNENKELVLKLIATLVPINKIETALMILDDENSFDNYFGKDTIEDYCKDTLKPLFKNQKFGIAEMVAEMNDHKTFNHLTKKYN
jgi:phospholipase C